MCSVTFSPVCAHYVIQVVRVTPLTALVTFGQIGPYFRECTFTPPLVKRLKIEAAWRL